MVDEFLKVLIDHKQFECEVLKLADMPSCLEGKDDTINERYGLTTKFRSMEFAFWLSALWRFESFSHSFFTLYFVQLIIQRLYPTIFKLLRLESRIYNILSLKDFYLWDALSFSTK